MDDLFIILWFTLVGVHGLMGIYFLFKVKRKRLIVLAFFSIFLLNANLLAFDVIEKPVKPFRAIDPIVSIPESEKKSETCYRNSEVEMLRHEDRIRAICANYFCSVRCSKGNCYISELPKYATLERDRIVNYCEINGLDCLIELK